MRRGMPVDQRASPADRNSSSAGPDADIDRSSSAKVKIFLACRSQARSHLTGYCLPVTDSTWPDLRRDNPGERPAGARRRQKQYLPSAQVVQELASLGPDLTKLADELRQCLSDSGD
jgi:hypothetical protein